MEEQITQEGFPTLEPVPTQDTLFSLAEFTVNNTLSLQDMQMQLRAAREMVKESFEQSPTFQEEKRKVEDVSKNLKAVKLSISQQPTVAEQLNRVKELQESIKERREQISFSALEYAKISGVDTIERDGAIYEIIKVAKIVRRKQ